MSKLFKLAIFLLLSIFIFTTCDNETDESLGRTPFNPFLVRNEAELRKVGTGRDGWNPDAHYRLLNDIDLTGGDSWLPIGTLVERVEKRGDGFVLITSFNQSFSGSFDGNNKTIKGFTFNYTDFVNYITPSESFKYGGMFCSVSEKGVVRNLKLEDVSIIHIDDSISSYYGIITAQNRGRIINCTISGSISYYGDDSLIGGIAGLNDNYGIIRNSFFSGTIDVIGDNNNIGGVAGRNDGTIQNSNYSGSVTGGNAIGVNHGTFE